MRAMLALVLAVAYSSVGCATAIHVPGAGAPVTHYRDCDQGRGPAIADLVGAGVWAGLTGGLIALQQTSMTDGGGPIVGVVFTIPLAIVQTVTGLSGWHRANRCRRVRAQYAEFLAQPPVPGACVPHADGRLTCATGLRCDAGHCVVDDAPVGLACQPVAGAPLAHGTCPRRLVCRRGICSR